VKGRFLFKPCHWSTVSPASRSLEPIPASSTITDRQSGEFPVCFCRTKTRLSLAALSKCRSSQAVCMSSFKLRTRRPSFFVPVHAKIFFVFFSILKIMPMAFVSKFGFAGQCLPLTKLSCTYIVQRLWILNSLSSSATYPSSPFSITFSDVYSLSFPYSPLLFSMHLPPSLLASSLALIILGVSAAPHETHLGKRCTNSASDRSCWGSYDLSTDYYTTVPDTGVTREVILPCLSEKVC
jgi:hypothetical protein